MATLKELMEVAEAKAEAAVSAMEKDGITLDEFTEHAWEYLRQKFMLKSEECKTNEILKLANDSIEKLLRLNDKSVELAVGSTTCTNQSSTDIKKVLLSLTLQRRLGVKMDPVESANCETVEQLAAALYRLLQEKRAEAA